MWNLLRKVLDMATENPDEPGPRGGHLWFFKDEVGLELWPYTATPFTASIGHRDHGKAMITGYPQGNEHPHWSDYDKDQDNIVFESQRWNCAKWNFPSSTYPAMLQGLRNLRSGPEMREIWEISDDIDRSVDGSQFNMEGDIDDDESEGKGGDGGGDGDGDGDGDESEDDDDNEDEMNYIKQEQFEFEDEETE